MKWPPSKKEYSRVRWGYLDEATVPVWMGMANDWRTERKRQRKGRPWSASQSGTCFKWDANEESYRTASCAMRPDGFCKSVRWIAHLLPLFDCSILLRDYWGQNRAFPDLRWLEWQFCSVLRPRRKPSRSWRMRLRRIETKKSGISTMQ